MIRLFVAIALPDAAADVLDPLMEGLPGADWTGRDDLHLTLRFAGDIAETQADDLDAALSGVRSPPFDLTLAGVGSFAEAGAIHAIWAGVEASAALAQLRGRCERAARQAGLTPDTRAWKPHVTLAYVRGVEPGRIAAWTSAHSLMRAAPFTVRSFGLYSSRRSGRGPVYRLERAYPLRDWPRGP